MTLPDEEARRRIAAEIGRLPPGGRARYRAALSQLLAEAEADALPASPAEAALALHRAALARSRRRYYGEGALEGDERRVTRRV